jgi:D-glycerate 3-kinase
MRRDASTQHGYADAVVDATLAALAGLLGARSRRPRLVGLSGLQGSGKSTFAHQLAAAANLRGCACVAFSLDDFYLGRSERLRLAREVHPLLATRGVPGTHDLGLLHATLDALATATPTRPVRVPRFDKGRDTRMAPSHWPHVMGPPRLVLFEGWCVGLPPQPAGALCRPLNALEREEDRGGRWRAWVNAQLAGDYAAAWRRLDRLVLLQAPNHAVVARWRDEQEHALRRRAAPNAMDRATLRRFLMHTERLGRHALRALPARADLRLMLDASRNVRAIRGPHMNA